MDDDLWDDADPAPQAPYVEVEISDPVVLGHLLGPDGNPIATLLDRPIVPFGFQPG